MPIIPKSSGILGINARNLLYVSRYNTKSSKLLADDKISTKFFLATRGIGTAKLYYAIRNLGELRNFKPTLLPRRFVIKPNHGYGGEGIIAIKEKRGSSYVSTAGKRYSWSDLFEHCVGILDGRYAISGLHDQIIFEELLEQHEYFQRFSDKGLPDIRIIVFHYVPVIAMLRLPTAESEGKANLHLGAIGLGIDMGTGRTTFAVRNNKLIKYLPNGEPVRSIIMPNWDEILLTASRTQHLTQIGYLAVDLALTKTGIKILELNARAGLAIQISNQGLLRNRLEKLSDVKVISPAEGVKLGKALFTRVIKDSKKKVAAEKPTIGLFEYVTVLSGRGGHALAKVDPHGQQTLIDRGLQLDENERLLPIKLKGVKLQIPFERMDLSQADHKIILSGKHLRDFLIDTTQTPDPYAAAIWVESRAEKIIHNVDKKLTDINGGIRLLARLKPLNLLEEQRRFYKNPTSSPKFIYHRDAASIQNLRSELKRIPRSVDHPLMPLYLKKIEELSSKLSLLDAVGSREIEIHSRMVYGDVTDTEYQEAKTLLNNLHPKPDASKKLGIDEITSRLETYLRENKLNKWKIKLLASTTADMQINKQNTILINEKVKFSENRLRALIAHEVETHIYRLENGREQLYKLFEQGTAGYLQTEEGIAMYNQQKLGIPLGSKEGWPALNVIAVHMGKSMSFAELFLYLCDEYDVDRDTAWKICTKVKRGLQDTSEHAVFTKDLVYYTGYRSIERFVREHGERALQKLYVGKIGVDDIFIIEKIKMQKPKLLPEYLRQLP
ncbi:MAG: tyrosine/phenylalanine carboxypeptidase domain-containing protein [Patescibacteria group bacterium]